MNLINLILPLTHNFQFNSIGTVATVKTFETAIKWAKLDASVLICCWLIQPFWLPSIVSCLTSSYLEDSSIPLRWYHRCRIQPDSMDAVEGQDPNVDSHKSRDRVTLSHMQTNPCGMRCSSVCLFTPREWRHLSLGCYYASYNRSNFVRTVTNPQLSMSRWPTQINVNLVNVILLQYSPIEFTTDWSRVVWFPI